MRMRMLAIGLVPFAVLLFVQGTAIPSRSLDENASDAKDQAHRAQVVLPAHSAGAPDGALEHIDLEDQRSRETVRDRIHALLAREENDLRQLHDQFEAALDEVAAVKILMEIVRVKQTTELRILKIQLDHPSPQRSSEETARLRSAIENLIALGATVEPASRPIEEERSEEEEQ